MSTLLQGAAAVGKALDVDCPRCGASANNHCTEKNEKTPPHVERGRSARWVRMGIN